MPVVAPGGRPFIAPLQRTSASRGRSTSSYRGTRRQVIRPMVGRSSTSRSSAEREVEERVETIVDAAQAINEAREVERNETRRMLRELGGMPREDSPDPVPPREPSVRRQGSQRGSRQRQTSARRQQSQRRSVGRPASVRRQASQRRVRSTSQSLRAGSDVDAAVNKILKSFQHWDTPKRTCRRGDKKVLLCYDRDDGKFLMPREFTGADGKKNVKCSRRSEIPVSGCLLTNWDELLGDPLVGKRCKKGSDRAKPKSKFCMDKEYKKLLALLGKFK